MRKRLLKVETVFLDLPLPVATRTYTRNVNGHNDLYVADNDDDSSISRIPLHGEIGSSCSEVVIP